MDIIGPYLRMPKPGWLVLRAIFRNMWEYEYVPAYIIARDAKMSENKVETLLKRLADEGLVSNKYTEYLGTSFTFLGLSVYSLHLQVKKGRILKIGKLMGEGKESVVYNCIAGSKWDKQGGNGEEAVIKFHRVGYPSFKKVKEKRDYGTLHFTVLTVRSARNEYNALRKLYGKVPVPRPISWEGNSVLMELIDARELFKVRLENPEEVLEMILEDVARMGKAGIVHGDLSQYNILVNEDGIWFIDFPQSVEIGEKGSEDILRRDVENILTYFRRTYGIERDINKVLKRIMEECRSLELT